jgi:predicted CxxxxCH...CXXCH cytochrome family protein
MMKARTGAPNVRRFGPGLVLAAAVSFAAAASCTKDRETAAVGPTYDDDVRAILGSKCASCHTGGTPAGGWSVASYVDVIGCVSPSGQAATLPADERAPILRAVDSPSHAGFLDASARATVASWVARGAPAFRADVHEPGIVDPRSAAFHGTTLRARRWAPMLDGNDDEACGRCHEGTPARPAGVTFAAPGAPACTTCHTDAGGVLGCTTCHGNGTQVFPPRDPCFFPADAARGGAHLAHLAKRSTHQTQLDCTTCHSLPGTPVIGGTHGDGAPTVAFDTKLVAPGGTYDPKTASCTVSCHDKGGAQARPGWFDPPATCGSCHASPPENHHPGLCTTCHREANADGTALSGGPMHFNGKVDLGDGTGGCGACHGKGDDPMPKTNAHQSHRSPSLGPAVDCGNCHQTHVGNLYDAGHLDGVVQVTLGGHAADRGVMPAWDGASCSNVACHGAGLVEMPTVIPTWTDQSGAAMACGACHGIPPINHTPATDCGRSDCHASQWTKDGASRAITELGKMLHIDGIIEVHGGP